MMSVIYRQLQHLLGRKGSDKQSSDGTGLEGSRLMVGQASGRAKSEWMIGQAINQSQNWGALEGKNAQTSCQST